MKSIGFVDGRFIQTLSVAEKESFVGLTLEEKEAVINEFKQIFGRDPTRLEMVELYTEELKLKTKQKGVKW